MLRIGPTMAARAGPLLLIAAISCACGSPDGATTPAAATRNDGVADGERGAARDRLGWVTVRAWHGQQDPHTRLPLTVVSLDEKAAIVGGRVVGGTASDATCPALLRDRRR